MKTATITSLGRAGLGLGVGYLLGAIPSADIASRLSAGDADLRSEGSENPGALNAGKTLGRQWGAAVLLADVAKGTAAAALGRSLAGPTVANLASSAAVVGHCYPPGRSGGKGVATSIGQVIGTFPRYLPLDIAVAVGTAALPKWTQRTWAGTAVASATWVGASTLAWAKDSRTGIDDSAPAGLPIGALISSAVIAKRFLSKPLTDGKPNQ